MDEITKNKRHGSKKRPNRLELSFSDEEWERVQSLAAEAGVEKVTDFLRELLVQDGIVTAALKPEERKTITDLGKVGTNIWEVRKKLIDIGVDEKTTAELKAMYDEFSKIRDYFKEKIKR